MKNQNPEVDAYIDDAPEFAQSILKRLWKLIHKGCPQIVETIKWGRPSFDHHGIVIGIAAFKQCAVRRCSPWCRSTTGNGRGT